MKRAFAYYRVSTKGQFEDGISLETQQKLCRQWAIDNDYQIIKEYTDGGKTGTKTTRKALKQMLADCGEDETDCIIVQDTDRLARNPNDHFAIKALLKKYNIQLISVSQPMLNENSAEAKFIDTVIAGVNAFQSDITGRKTAKVLQAKAAIGWYPGGVPMLGYHNVINPNPTPGSKIDTKIIDLNQDIAPHVKKCFEDYATGNFNTQQLADYLNSKNILSPQENKIHRSYIARMLRSEFYLGVFIWNKVRYANANHPKLITQELYMKVQQVLGDHNQNATRKRKHNMLLRGYIFCTDCQKQMWGERHEKENGTVIWDYFCHHCGKGSYIDRDTLEGKVASAFKKIELDKSYVAHVLATAKKILEEDRSNQHNEKVRLYHEKTKIEKAMKEAEDARFRDNTLSVEAFNRIYPRYETQLNNIDVDIEGLKKDHSYSISVLEKVLELAENIGEAYEKAPYLLKRKYLGIFFKKFYVKNGKITRFSLTDELKPLIENGSARVTSIGLLD